MNPERFAELQRQRDLVRTHLAWLEAEIAREHTITPQAVPPAVVSVAIRQDPVAPLPTASFPSPDPKASAADARRGCLLLFFAILALLAIGLTAIFFIRYRDRPLLFAPAAESR